MAEEIKAVVPIGLNESPVQPAQQRPEWARKSLHNVKLGQALYGQTEAKAPSPAPTPTPAPQPSQAELSQQVASLQTAVNALAERQSGNMAPPEREAVTLDQLRQHNRYGSGPYGVAPDQPDPLNHDFYDEDSTAEYHHLNNGYIERTVQQRLEAERASQAKASEAETLKTQLAAAETRFGRDANYMETMQAAIDRAAESDWKLPFEEAYLQVSNETEAKKGRGRSSYLPPELKTLGAIVRYNIETGRAR
jgi:hypothetical protein